MNEGHHAAKADTLADNLSALASLLERIRNRDGEDGRLLFEEALELVRACQALIDEEEAAL